MPDIFDQLAAQKSPQAQPQQVAQSGDVFDQLTANGNDPNALMQTPGDQGQVTNDVGNTLVVPKNPGTGDEEPFEDTLKRAIALHKSMSGAQQQEAIDKEMGSAPKKAAEVALSVPVAAALPIASAESLLAAHAALSAGWKALGPALARGIEGIGDWAEAHPYAREILKAGLKGAAAYAGFRGAGIASKVIKAE